MSEEENAAQHERCIDAFGVLRQKMEEAKPDVILVFGDDQEELFGLDNFPAFSIFVGEEFEGYRTSARTGFIPGEQRGWREKTSETWVKVQSHPQLAQELAVGLTHRDFDISFSFEAPNKEHGMGHAFMRPLHRIVPNFDIPMVPFFVNCYFGPQPSANRCYRLGRAVREVIEASPLDLRVAVLGSGGLWHTPGSPTSWLNTEFDERILSYIPTGNGKGMADEFDAEGASASGGLQPTDGTLDRRRHGDVHRNRERHRRDAQLGRCRGRGGRQTGRRVGLRAGLRVAVRHGIRVLGHVGQADGGYWSGAIVRMP